MLYHYSDTVLYSYTVLHIFVSLFRLLYVPLHLCRYQFIRRSLLLLMVVSGLTAFPGLAVISLVRVLLYITDFLGNITRSEIDRLQST